MNTHNPYPSDVSDLEWEVVLPYLCPLPEDADQRVHNLRDIFDALRRIVRSDAPWRNLPKGFPPWRWSTRRPVGGWPAAASKRSFTTSATSCASPGAGARAHSRDPGQPDPPVDARAGYDGYKRRKGPKVHAEVDTLGHLLALHVTPAGEQDRAQVGALAEAVRAATGESVELAFVDQGYTAEAHGIVLEVV